MRLLGVSLAFLLSSLSFAEESSTQVATVDTVAGRMATGYLGIGNDPNYTREKFNTSNLPESFDWKEQGFEVPIKDQTSRCGSCWSFSITKSLEYALMIQAGKPLYDLSEQQMVSCERGAFGCGGGFMSSAKYVVNPGLTNEESFPYVARNVSCKPNLPIKGKAVSYHLLGSSTRKPTTAEIKAAIMKYGPVFVTVAAGGNGWAGRTGEVTGCRNRNSNHMVVLTGWTADGKWQMANSWSKNWGNQGYSLIKFGCDKIADNAGYLVVEQEQF